MATLLRHVGWRFKMESQINAHAPAQHVAKGEQYLATSKKYSLFSRDVVDILKCKIAEPLSFQLSLAIEHPKYISF